MRLFSFRFNHWQYPFSMSIAYYFLIEFSIQLNKEPIILISMIKSFSLLFAFIPEGIYIHRCRTELSSIHKQKAVPRYKKGLFRLITYHNSRMHSKLILCLYVIIGVLSIFSNYLFNEFILIQRKGYSTIHSFFSLLLTWVVSYFIFRRRLFKHHSLSLAIIGLSLVLYYSIMHAQFSQTVDELYGSWVNFLLVLVLFCLVSSLREVIEKYLMEKHFISPFRLMIVEGVIPLAFAVLLISFSQLATCGNMPRPFCDICYQIQWNQFIADFSALFNFTSIGILSTIGFIGFNFAMHCLRTQTNKNLTPTHRYVAEMLFLFYFFMRDIVVGKKKTVSEVVLNLLNSLLLIFACLVFNEYIIINACGLNSNTVISINERATNDMKIGAAQLEEEIMNENLIDDNIGEGEGEDE